MLVQSFYVCFMNSINICYLLLKFRDKLSAHWVGMASTSCQGTHTILKWESGLTDGTPTLHTFYKTGCTHPVHLALIIYQNLYIYRWINSNVLEFIFTKQKTLLLYPGAILYKVPIRSLIRTLKVPILTGYPFLNKVEKPVTLSTVLWQPNTAIILFRRVLNDERRILIQIFLSK